MSKLSRAQRQINQGIHAYMVLLMHSTRKMREEDIPYSVWHEAHNPHPLLVG